MIAIIPIYIITEEISNFYENVILIGGKALLNSGTIKELILRVLWPCVGYWKNGIFLILEYK